MNVEAALLEPIVSEKGTESKKHVSMPFALRFAEKPIEAVPPSNVTTWCSTTHSTFEATGLHTDASGSDED